MKKSTLKIQQSIVHKSAKIERALDVKSIFVRHYWSPAIEELSQRVLWALEELKQTTFS
ncbi:MAG: hypothetical protein JSV29_07110 [Candidatus Bathyarchaeota archaeon]|nr:MAG: hypothetical protein JSV29_07110 [Candidatus Bathyarchaeota archaeon]